MQIASRVRRGSVTAVACVLILGLGVGVGAGLQMRAEDAAGIGTIKTSYAFDVTNTGELLEYADDAFIGEVLGVEATEESRSTTVWRVRVTERVKGNLSGTVLVRQLGYVDKDSRTHVAENQPLLVPGSRQLLVTTHGDAEGVLTLVAGPRSSVAVKTSSDQARVLAEYRAAAR